MYGNLSISFRKYKLVERPGESHEGVGRKKSLIFGFVLCFFGFAFVLWFCLRCLGILIGLLCVQVRNRLLLRLVSCDEHACLLLIHFPASTNLWNDLARAMNPIRSSAQTLCDDLARAEEAKDRKKDLARAMKALDGKITAAISFSGP